MVTIMIYKTTCHRYIPKFILRTLFYFVWHTLIFFVVLYVLAESVWGLKNFIFFVVLYL